jgi:hypothetical protein
MSLSQTCRTRRLSSPSRFGFLPVAGTCALMLGGCANVPLEQGDTLTSYDSMTPMNGRLTKAKFKVEEKEAIFAKTVYIEPTTLSTAASRTVQKPSDGTLVANAIIRALCIGVSDRLVVVDSKDKADIVIHATVTRVVPTNATVAGVSTATSLGASVYLPVPVPRIPFGLGGLSVEAEATDRDGRQVGAMVWSKGANAITTSARMSQIGDAYSLASSFGNDFSKMLVTGKTPFKGLPKLPSAQKVKSGLGGKPKYAACEKFGRAPGLKDFAGSQVGLPPSWTDKQPAPQSQ